jgi:hypothetical protein
MPQANQLELQGGAAAKPEGEDGNDSGQNRNHACDGTAVRPKALDFRQFTVLSMHSMHDPFNGAKSTLPGKRLSVGGHHYLREGWF